MDHHSTTAFTLAFQMPWLRGGAITDRHSNVAVVTQWISHPQALSNGHLGQLITLPKGPLLGILLTCGTP